MAVPLPMKLDRNRVVVNNDLEITFRRTVRVPDNHQTSYLPPDLGQFPLKAVSQYASKMRTEMSAKGGLFFPMYQSEAMWMSFKCSGTQDYMIKVYVGGVNAISGEPAAEDLATKLRRQTLLVKHEDDGENASPLQDYVVVPGQKWLDGIADTNGTVRQFVAMPFGSGHSVESQVTGKDTAGGIQIEVTPYNPRPVGPIQIFVKTLRGDTVMFQVHPWYTVDDLKHLIELKENIPSNEQRLIFSGRQLKNNRILSDCNITNHTTVYLVLGLRGGGGGPMPNHHEMSIAVGGRIHQSIVADNLGTEWLPDRTTVFNIQILNSVLYPIVTGESPPRRPMTAKVYQRLGYSFYKIYEEPSGIHGELGAVQSVAQVDDDEDTDMEIKTAPLHSRCVDLVSTVYPLRRFRTVSDIKKELKKVHIASF